MAKCSDDRPVLGILGGMGPLASAAFVRNVYELNCASLEQRMPRLLLDSDPSFPDRSEAIRSGNSAVLSNMLNQRLALLLESGATKIVIACVTAHHFVNQLDPQIQSAVVSLPSIMVAALTGASGNYLLLATAGTHQARILQREPGWPEIADRVQLPSLADQDVIHKLIYDIKQLGVDKCDVVDGIANLMNQYSCTGVILGCTEFHLYSQDLIAIHGSENVIDGLWIIAVTVHELLASGQVT